MPTRRLIVRGAQIAAACGLAAAIVFRILIFLGPPHVSFFAVY